MIQINYQYHDSTTVIQLFRDVRYVDFTYTVVN